MFWLGTLIDRMRDAWTFHGRSIVLTTLLLVVGAGVLGKAILGRTRTSPAPSTPPVATDDGTSKPAPGAPSTGETRPDEAQSLDSQFRRTAEQGDWAKVDVLAFQARKQAEEDPRFLALAKETAAPLRVDCHLRATLPPGRAGSPSGAMTLAEGDDYWLQLGFSTRCYLYVFEQDPSGRLRVLFPSPTYSSLVNPVEGQARIPEDYSKQLGVAAGTPGMRTIHVLAARWQQKRLEELMARGLDTAGPDALAFLNAAKEHTANIAGLSYGTYQFQQEAGSTPANAPASAKL